MLIKLPVLCSRGLLLRDCEIFANLRLTFISSSSGQCLVPALVTAPNNCTLPSVPLGHRLTEQEVMGPCQKYLYLLSTARRGTHERKNLKQKEQSHTQYLMRPEMDKIN